ncbi:MAG: AAA family ATPase [Muribaculaceae bacterium]|nr:AAA family ATPase [Muribaculaceae bacterium]
MKFSDIPGHEAVKERLRAMADSDRLPHALLLQGPAGIGKFMLARALAQYIHCENPVDGDSCGRCASCLQHQSFNHIDTIFSYPVIKKKSDPVSDDYSSEWQQFLSDSPYMDFAAWQKELGKADGQPVIYVSESNDLLRKLNFTAHSSRYKVVLMWLPERMNEGAANKLLKLIEEPFPDTRIVMVANDADKILPTIYSRTQRIEVKRLPDELLAHLLEKEYGLDHADAMAVAHIANGSMIEARHQIDLTSQRTEQLEYFKQMMRLAYARNVKGMKDWANELADLKREGVMQFLRYCMRLVRENFIYGLKMPEVTYLNRHEEEFSQRFARFINERNVEQIITQMESALTDVSGNANPKIVLFDLAIKMIILIKQ